MKKEEIEKIFDNLKQATIKMYEISKKEEAIQKEKIAIREELRLARQEASSIDFTS